MSPVAEPSYVQTLSSGAKPADNPVTLHPVIAEDLGRQLREMEQARAQAAVSCDDYLVALGAALSALDGES